MAPVRSPVDCILSILNPRHFGRPSSNARARARPPHRFCRGGGRFASRVPNFRDQRRMEAPIPAESRCQKFGIHVDGLSTHIETPFCPLRKHWTANPQMHSQPAPKHSFQPLIMTAARYPKEWRQDCNAPSRCRNLTADKQAPPAAGCVRGNGDTWASKTKELSNGRTIATKTCRGR